MLNSGLLLLFSNLILGLIMVGRNVLIANFISVEHYGIAMTFAITVSLIEIASSLMAETYIVKSETGDDPKTSSVLHTVSILRGILNAVLLFLAAPYIAALFQVPDLTWAYQIMAIIPLLRGVTHIDLFRVQRHGAFRPKVIVEVASFVCSLLAAWVLVLLWGDFRAMLGTLCIQWGVFALMSHVVAKRSYRISWDRAVFKDLFTFGWPLMLNAMVAYLVLNGDRVIVGNQLGLEVLGWFSAAFMLAQTPSMLLMSARRTLFMPQISKKGPGQAQAHRVSIEVALFLGLGFAVGTALAGPFFLTALYGDRYLPAVPIMLWLGLIMGVRIARGGLITSAISQGETKKVLIASLVRVLALPLAWVLLKNGGQLSTLMALLLISELIAFAVSFALISPIAKTVTPATLASLGLGLVIFLVTQLTEPVLWQDWRFEPLHWMLIPALFAGLVAMPALRKWIRQELTKAPQK